MGKIDVFLSYEHSLKSVVDRICSELESEGVRCWYAPRDVIGDYATSIVNAIDDASVFVVLLNNESSKSPHVLNEVEMAYKRIINNQGELTILPFKLDDKDLSKAMEYYVKRMHWIDASLQGIENAVKELKNKIKAILKPSDENKQVAVQRYSNMYFSDGDVNEKERLIKQRILLEKFDKTLYDEVAEEKTSMRILDLGSNNGDFIMNRLGGKDNLETLLGLEYNADAVNNANEKYMADNVRFEQCNLEENLESKLGELCEKYGIKDFNVVNLSMILLHIKDPIKMLKAVRKFTKPSATVIVKDIDDGLNIVYPDNKGYFEHAMQLCLQDDYGGYRYSGRQVYNILHKAGFKNISLIKSGMNTTGMDYDEKQALFDVYFSFIKSDYQILKNQAPDNELYKQNVEWFDKHYEEMEDAFLEDDFFFNLGFMLFKAER